jgi:uncharacterized protein
MKVNLSIISIFSLLVACNSPKKEFSLFKELTFESGTESVLLAEKLSYTILFREESDTVFTAEGKFSPAKRNHDYTYFMADEGNPNSGWLYISHECNDSSTVLGDGGGATMFRITKNNGKWQKVSNFENVDFSAVGGTYDNCAGAVTPWGTLLTAEEFPPFSNLELYKKGKGTRDTSDINGMKRFEHTGWMVEVDLKTKKAIRKLYNMGRYSHEGAWVMPDGKTVYLTDDFNPSVFFKFVADKENDLSEGQLFAYAQGNDKKGSWIPLPMHIDSLIDCRNVALRLGATIFTRMEWMTFVNGKLYITETGDDDFSLSKATEMGGKPNLHLSKFKKEENTYDYPYGSVLVFNPQTDVMDVLLHGGKAEKDTNKHFSNPDGITHYQKNGKTYLVINEDIIGKNKGRISGNALSKNQVSNEIYWLDLAIASPKIDDLKRLLIAPYGSETTGGYFNPDYSTYFVNIQHPSTDNKPPFNKSCTIAVEGFKE